MNDDISQTPIRFGPEGALVGMLTTPAHQAPADVACLMFNMGANHRVGPRRINVKLAHVLAARGVSSLRFDLGGIGDSDASGSSHDVQGRALGDLCAAMDLVESRLGIRQFAIVGMCSGVEHAVAAGVTDSRVVALTLFDGYAFPERRARWERTLRRALAAPVHPSFPGKAKRWVLRRLLRSHAATPLPGFFTEKQPMEQNAAWFGANMRRLVERHVAVQLLYSASLHVNDHDRDQLGAFAREPFAKALQYEFMREVDHTFCTARGQQLFLKSVGDWVCACACADIAAGERRPPPQAVSPTAGPSLHGAYVPQ